MFKKKKAFKESIKIAYMNYTKINNAVDELRHYLNLNFNEYDVTRIRRIIRKAYTEVPKVQVVHEKVYVFKNHPSPEKDFPSIEVMEEVAKEIADKWGIDYKYMRTPLFRGGSRKPSVVSAKKEFIIRMFTEYNPSDRYISDFLKCDRSTVIYHKSDGYTKSKLTAYRRFKRKQDGKNIGV